MTVNDLPGKVKFLSKGKKENFLALVRTGRVSNPIKLDVEVYLCDDGGLYFIDRDRDKEFIIWKEVDFRSVWEIAVEEGRKAFESSLRKGLNNG